MKTKKDVPNMTKEEGIQQFIDKAKDGQMNKIDTNNISIDNNGNISRNISSVIVVNKPIKEEELKRVSYYLKPSTIKKIAKLAAKTDMKISPWFQKFLEENLDKIEIK
jgi:hypothetical protein